MPGVIEFLAHAMLAAPFAVSAADKAMRPRAALGEVRALERGAALALPPRPLLWAVIAVQALGAGLLLIMPWSAYGALILLAFLAPTSLLTHRFWSAPRGARMDKLNHFLLNLALGGGLVLVASRNWP